MTREEAIEILQGAIKKPNTKDGYLGQAIDMAIETLEQEPRKGHWIESDYGNMITQHRWYCSECGGMHNDPESGEWREVFDFKYDYCPLCGAKMAEQEET